MSSGGLLLLLGLLTLWVELTPISGQTPTSGQISFSGQTPVFTQDRPEFCYLPPLHGPCKAHARLFYYNPAEDKCLEFDYGGCRGNANRFSTKEECRYACIEKHGVCPQAPQRHPCLEKCMNDWQCPGEQKCCRYDCRSECKDAAYDLYASPTKKPSRAGTTVRT